MKKDIDRMIDQIGAAMIEGEMLPLLHTLTAAQEIFSPEERKRLYQQVGRDIKRPSYALLREFLDEIECGIMAKEMEKANETR